MNTEPSRSGKELESGLLQSLLASLEVPVLVLDQSLSVVRANQALERFTGFSIHEIQGKPVSDNLVVSDWAEDLSRRFASIIPGEKREIYDFPLAHKRGAILVCPFRVSTLQAGDDVLYVCVGIPQVDAPLLDYSAHLSNHLMWRATSGGTIIDCNRAVVDYCGMTEADVIDGGWGRLVHVEDVDHAVENWRSCIPLGKSFEGRLRLRRRDGEYRWHHCCTYPGSDETNHGQIWFGACFDVHEDHLASITIREREQWLRTLFQAMHDGLTVRDREGKIALVNHASQRIMGLTADQLSGVAPSDPRWSAFGPDGHRLAINELPSVLAVSTGKAQFDYLMCIRHPDGRETWVNVNSVPVLEADGTASWVVATYADVTEHVNQRNIIAEQKRSLEVANAKLHTLAVEDGLTGLLNHRALHERLNDAYARARREESTLSLILLDVDMFKRYNDAHGHLAGDEVLRRLGATLGREIQGNNIVGRYGGEEFLVILPDTDFRGAYDVAERLRHAVAGSEFEFGPVTASFGVVNLNEQHLGAGQLLDMADRAMYAAKLSGRNRVMPMVPEESDATR